MIGRTISHYEILDKLGEGGMGAVYRARDTRLDRVVALKFLSTERVGSADDRESLLREAKITAAVSHPNVCALIDIHQSPSENFLVMEYVDGRSLREEIGKGPMAADRAASIAIQVAEGLRAAHGKGITHRDIKPENILIDTAGTAKITDFGLARKADRPPEQGDLSGTVSYMSPEQLRGDHVDRTTDLWSLGVVLYEMVSGHRPFEGDYHQAIIYSILHEQPRPSEALAGEGAGIGRVVGRCLEKIPEVRYRDADALLEELRNACREMERPATESDRAVAVLPFADLSEAGDNRYFSEGLTEEIISALSKMKRLRVVSKTTVTQFDRAGKNTRQIASELGVGHILEGSVRKRGSDLLINTQLIDASTDTYLWSGKYPGTMDDVFTIQENVASKIAKALKLQLTPGEKKSLKSRPTESAEAYQLYLKGRFHWNRRSREGIETAIRYFKRAIAKDRNYALAWSGLSDGYNLLSEYHPGSRSENYPKAKKAVERAIELDPQLAEARTSLASLNMLYLMDWVNAEKEFRLSLYLRPDYATTHHWLAELLAYTGRPDEAVAEISRAHELDPLSPAIAKDRGMVFYYVRRFHEAIGMGKKTLEMDRTFVAAHRLLSLSYAATGRKADAVAENRTWGEQTGNRIEEDIWLAYIHAACGDPAAARHVLRGVPLGKLSNGYQYRGLAIVHANLGDNDAAFKWLEKAHELRSESIASMKIDHKLERLRPDPRFREMLKKLGLEK